MDPRRVSAAYALLVAVVVLGFWTVHVATGSVAGVRPDRGGVGWHVLAEVASAVLLLAAGLALLADRPRGRDLLLVGLGSILYAAPNAAGLYEAWWVRVPVLASLPATALVLAWTLRSDRLPTDA